MTGRATYFWRITSIGMLAVVGGLAVGGFAAGQGRAPGPTSLAEERQALQRARAQAEDARRRSEAFERQAAQSARAADKAQDQAAAMAARIQQAEADLRASQARIAILTGMQSDQRRRLAARQAPIARLIAALQWQARRPPVLGLLRPGSITDTVHLRMVLGQVMPVIAARTAGLRAELNRSKQLRADAELARAALTRSRNDLATRRAALSALETRQRVASRQYGTNAAVESERAVAIGEDAHDIAALMDRMEAASGTGAALINLPGPTLRPIRPSEVALPAADALAQTAGTPAYQLPVVGDIVTGFGEISDSGVRSRGLTIATEPGATVIAPANGRIAFAGRFREYGEIAIIDHGGGWTTLVTHLRRLAVAVGDSVRQGDPVGVAASAKPLVTIELRKDDRPVDIAALLR